MGRGFHNSKTPEHLRGKWRTPPQLFSTANQEFQFQADVAASDKNHLCQEYLTEEDDALSLDWRACFGECWVWCNPPYDDIMPWVIKAAEQVTKGVGTVMLVPASTAVGWYAEALETASEVRVIIGGRIGFLYPDTDKRITGNMGGSVLFIFDPNDFPEEIKTTYVHRDVLMGIA